MTYKCLKKWFSVTLPFFPMLILYGFEILPFLTFSDYLLIFFIMATIVKSGFKLKLNKAFMPLVIYLVVQPLLILCCEPENIDYIDAFGTAWKLAIYIFGIALLKKILQIDYFIKYVRYIGIFSTIYGFLQYILGTYARISLSPYLPFLPIIRIGLDDQQSGWIAYNLAVRPRAWFSEPAAFAIFLLMALLIELFIVSKENRSKTLCLIYSFGIIISHSSTGTIGLVILLLTWMLIYPKDFLYRIPQNIVVGFLILLPVCGFLLYRSGYVEAFIGHTFVNGQGILAQSHFIDVQAVISEDTSFVQMILGKGMQNVEAGYLPGWVRTYYCLGLIGVLLYLDGFYRIYRQCSNKARIIIVTFVGLNVGTEIMLGVFMLIYMLAIMLPEYSNEGILNEHTV